MTLPNLPEVPQKATLEQLTQIVAELSQQLTYLLSGFLGSQNILEAGGWRVGPTELQSKDKTVGMSTDKTGVDPVRFWAGDVKTGSPKFKVTESGETTLTEAIISSAETGDKVVLDSTGLHTYVSGVERLTIGTAPVQGVKAIVGRDSTGAAQSVYTYDTESLGTGQYITAHSAVIFIKDDGSIIINDSLGSGFRLTPGAFPEMRESGIDPWVTLAQSGELTSTQPNHDHGISAGVTLATTSDGSTVDGFVTWVPSGGHSHTQT